MTYLRVVLLLAIMGTVSACSDKVWTCTCAVNCDGDIDAISAVVCSNDEELSSAISNATTSCEQNRASSCNNNVSCSCACAESNTTCEEI